MFFCAPVPSWAQQLEVTPFTGYTFASGFDITGGRAKLEGNINWGLSLGYTPKRFTEWEISYNFLGTQATATSIYLNEDVVSRAQLHFLMIGANRMIFINEKLVFFSGLKLGSAGLRFPDDDFNAQSKLSFGIQAGLKYKLTDQLGLRTQANLLLPIINEGGSLWWNPNSGTSISGWSPIVPFSLNLGLVIRF